MSRKTPNSWQTLSRQLIYENPWIRLEEHQVTNPAGQSGVYGKICFKSQAVAVIPIDDQGNTWLVGQHRYTLDEWSWELPMGGSPLGEDCLQTAYRELEEEAGLIAASMQQVLHLHTSNSVTDEQAYVFLARGLSSGTQALEDSEQDLQIKKLAFNEALQMTQDGRITDAISVAGLQYLALNAGRYAITI